MANTFKVITFAAEPNSAGTAYTMYTVAGSTTTVVLGLILTNIHSSAVTAEVELVSDTSNRAGANNADNGTMVQVAMSDVKTYLNSAGYVTDDPTALAIALG